MYYFFLKRNNTKNVCKSTRFTKSENTFFCEWFPIYSRNQKRKRNVITLQKTTEQLQCATYVLHKTTDHTTPNYRPYYTKLRYTDYTTYKLSTHATDTNQVSCTQIRYSDIATYILHTNLTWYILEMSIFAVALGYSSQWAIVILPLR